MNDEKLRVTTLPQHIMKARVSRTNTNEIQLNMTLNLLPTDSMLADLRARFSEPLEANGKMLIVTLQNVRDYERIVSEVQAACRTVVEHNNATDKLIDEANKDLESRDWDDI